MTKISKVTFERIVPIAIDLRLPGSKPNPNGKAKRRRGKAAIVSDALFASAIALILILALYTGTGNGTPKSIFSLSFFTVETPSMQDAIPQGSFILVRSVAPKSLKEGDDITFLAGRGTTVTHRIVGIREGLDGGGTLGFQTQGVNNTDPDYGFVDEADVIGKVVLVLPVVGTALSFLSENVFLAFLILGLCILLSFLLRGLFTKPGLKRGGLGAKGEAAAGGRAGNGDAKHMADCRYGNGNPYYGVERRNGHGIPDYGADRRNGQGKGGELR